jgi:hypothetical protein
MSHRVHTMLLLAALLATSVAGVHLAHAQVWKVAGTATE